MKKIITALLLLGAVETYSAESIGGPAGSTGAFIDSLRVHAGTQKAIAHFNTAFWGTSTYAIDISVSNPTGRDMLAVALSAINTGKSVRVTVDVPGSCGGTTSSPSCSWGANILSITLKN